MDEIKKLKKEIINTEINIKNNVDKKNNIDNLSSNLKTIEPQIDKLHQIYINKNKELEFITALEDIANKNNIQQTMDLKNFPEKNSDFGAISLEINSQGTYKNLMSYLTDIETSSYYINIHSISINRGSIRRPNPSVSEEESLNAPVNLIMNFKADTYLK
jgi:Tfp pilus assembly protein PilO